MSIAEENARLRAQIEALERKVAHAIRQPSNAERDLISATHARADSVARLYGTTASQIVPGEDSLQYRRRLLAPFAKHSERHRTTRTESIPADLIGVVEEQIYNDAATAALDSASHTPGALVPIQERDTAGRLVTRFVGDIATAFAPFMTPGKPARIVRNPPSDRW